MAKKKEKIKTLSDEEYGQYLMAMKDEKPDKVLKPEDGKKELINRR